MPAESLLESVYDCSQIHEIIQSRLATSRIRFAIPDSDPEPESTIGDILAQAHELGNLTTANDDVDTPSMRTQAFLTGESNRRGTFLIPNRGMTNNQAIKLGNEFVPHDANPESDVKLVFARLNDRFIHLVEGRIEENEASRAPADGSILISKVHNYPTSSAPCTSQRTCSMSSPRAPWNTYVCNC